VPLPQHEGDSGVHPFSLQLQFFGFGRSVTTCGAEEVGPEAELEEAGSSFGGSA
jgi:hypothetical protein